jgi:hypothetical protein
VVIVLDAYCLFAQRDMYLPYSWQTVQGAREMLRMRARDHTRHKKLVDLHCAAPLCVAFSV